MIHVQASGASDSDYHYIINTTRSEKAQWHNSKLPMQKEIQLIRTGLQFMQLFHAQLHLA